MFPFMFQRWELGAVEASSTSIYSWKNHSLPSHLFLWNLHFWSADSVRKGLCPAHSVCLGTGKGADRW